MFWDRWKKQKRGGGKKLPQVTAPAGSWDYYRQVYQNTRDFLAVIDKEKEKSASRTFCGFAYGDGPCAVCMQREVCQSQLRSASSEAWRRHGIALKTLSQLEKDIREALEKDPDSVEGKGLLASVLRTMAADTLVISRNDDDKIREAEEIFSSLFYETGDSGWREEAESCRTLRIRR